MSNTIEHIQLMVETMQESKNNAELLATLDTLVTIMVDSDSEYLKGGSYTRELTHKQLTIKVIYNAHK